MQNIIKQFPPGTTTAIDGLRFGISVPRSSGLGRHPWPDCMVIYLARWVPLISGRYLISLIIVSLTAPAGFALTELFNGSCFWHPANCAIKYISFFNKVSNFFRKI